MRPPWDRLRLLLGLSSDPALLVTEPRLSPFNLSVPIRLSELAEPDVALLVVSYNLGIDDEALDGLMRWTAGHPALCRVACFRAACTGEALTQVLAAAAAEGGCFHDQVSRWQRALAANPELSGALLAACRGAPGLASPEATRRLEAAGLLRRRDGAWAPRNGLVAQLVASL